MIYKYGAEPFCADINEVLRYMGMQGEPDFVLAQKIQNVVRQCEQGCTPMSVFCFTNLTVNDGDVCAGELKFASKQLSHHLKGCNSGVLFAATLGAFADRMILRCAHTSPSEMVIYQAVSAAMIEAYANVICDKIQSLPEVGGKCLTSRYSPGYGDFSLSAQRGLLGALCAESKLGLRVTENNMMTPTKSISAVMGIGGTTCTGVGCDTCGKTDCLYRKQW